MDSQTLLLLRPILRVVVFLIAAVPAAAALLVLCQDYLVFPAASRRLILGRPDESEPPPAETESFFLSSGNDPRFEVWRMRPAGVARPFIAILFQGNGSNLFGFTAYQDWFRRMGIASYAMEYRGVGRSGGWPNEAAIYADAETLWKHVIETEGVCAQQVIVFGISLGTGPAAHIAALYQPRALVLFAPYTSFPEVVASKPIYRYLAPFVKPKFPNRDNIAALTTTCVVALHGTKDKVVPVQSTYQLETAYRGQGRFHRIIAPLAGHNDLLDWGEQEARAALDECLKQFEDTQKASGTTS